MNGQCVWGLTVFVSIPASTQTEAGGTESAGSEIKPNYFNDPLLKLRFFCAQLSVRSELLVVEFYINSERNAFFQHFQLSYF